MLTQLGEKHFVSFIQFSIFHRSRQIDAQFVLPAMAEKSFSPGEKTAIKPTVSENSSQSEDCGVDMAIPGSKSKRPSVQIDFEKSRFPYCIVWTPIPFITWFIPIIGHMGIATSSGVIRDFAGPYYVSEDEMAFGKPTKYWKLESSKVLSESWDWAVSEASDEYKKRMHNLCCDNCHSHVAMALNLMRYNGSSSWNMVKLCFMMLIYSHYVSVCAFLKTWLPFLIMSAIVITLSIVYST